MFVCLFVCYSYSCFVDYELIGFALSCSVHQSIYTEAFGPAEPQVEIEVNGKLLSTISVFLMFCVPVAIQLKVGRRQPKMVSDPFAPK